MFGWEYNKKMMKTYMVDHAEDIGRFWAEMCIDSPKIYTDFMSGFFEEFQKRTQTEKKE